MRHPQQMRAEVLDAPIVPTLLRLAAPNVAINAMLAVSSGVDAYYIGKLGSDSLAGVSLAFPALTLMQGLVVGGLGVGVTSAIARAMGAGDREKAQALASHALALALGLATVFAVALCAGGPALYGAMGARSHALGQALAYSNVMFGGAAALWLFQTLSAVVRGSGRMGVPAALVVGGELLHLGLAPLLMFGWGPVRALGIAGAAASVVALAGTRLALLAIYLRSSRAPIRISFQGFRPRAGLFWEILRVAAPASIGALLMNGNVLFATGFVGRSGPSAVAGYGMGARLEYLLALVAFGLGAAILTMVGMNRGAGKSDRAERVAWRGAAITAGVCGLVGGTVALFPSAYMHAFSTEPEVVDYGCRYLSLVAPTYLFFGCGLALFFAAQGAGKPRWPLFGSLARFAATVGGGWLGLRWFGGVGPVFAAIATGFMLQAGVLVVAVRRGILRAGPVRAAEVRAPAKERAPGFATPV